MDNKGLISDISNYSIEEKKRGYSKVLSEFLYDLHKGDIRERKSKVFAEYLHILPHFLGEDLKDFNEVRFWDRVLNNKRYSSEVFGWFLEGVYQRNLKIEYIKEMQELRDNEKAE
jgi:hypothetical protein